MNPNLNNPLRIAVIGAGVRGTGLARKLSSSAFPVVIAAVAEPDEERRVLFAREFNLPESASFTGWEKLCEELENCDAAVIATLDNQHTGPALACLNRNWHLLMEKPLADSFEDCLKIVKTREAVQKVIAVCHTLRFMEGYQMVKQILDKGDIGKLIHLEHMEGIGHTRFAHNYVRGRWAQEKLNTFLLLHKCSHDIDYISWLFREPCERVSSFGSLKFFTSANAPQESTLRCTDGCPLNDTCPYSALRLYVDTSLSDWPAREICRVHTYEEHLNSVKHGPYGLCVWHAGNDVVDHQVVMMEFEGGSTATCTLSGYSATNGRRIRLQGTLGELLFDEAAGTISIKKFSENKEKIINIPNTDAYHPEDREIVDDWISSITRSTPVEVTAMEALRTHAVVFAAELSRNESRTVEMKEFQGKYRNSRLP